MPALIRSGVFTLLYIAGAALAEHLIHGVDRITLVWLPAGVSFAALLLYGRRYWPFIPVAEALVQISAPDFAWSFVAVTVIANTAAALAGTTFAVRFAGRDRSPFVLRSIAVLLAAALLLALVSASLGVAGLTATGYIPAEVSGAAFLKWSIANFFGTVLVAPAVVVAVQSRSWAADAGLLGIPGAVRERGVWAALMLGSLLLLLNADRTTSSYVLGLSALPLSLLVWSALRFAPLFTALASLLVGLTLSVLAGLGLAGFGEPEHLIDAVILLGYLTVIAVVPLVLGAATQENRLTAYRLVQSARRDELTGLPNRTGFANTAEHLLAEGRERQLALVYIDLDSFKLINDTASHVAGDELIRRLAGLLRAQLREQDVLARLGGDEFAMLLIDVDPALAERLCLRIRDAVAEFRFPWQGHVFSTTASIGVVPFLAGNIEYSALLAQADATCFAAKELGGNRVQVGRRTEGAASERTNAMQWAMRLSAALDQDHFRLYCQSIAPLTPRADRGRHFEILIRLYDPEQDRILMPGQFVPAAERFRMGTRLDRHVIDRSLRWLEQHPQALSEVRHCGINLCAASVDDEGFVPFLRERLARSSVPADRLCFEITETSAVRDLGDAQRFIGGVREIGCRLALDDFGTGFCSFAYLNALDVDYFKIDGSFVREIETSALSLSIVKAIADIARGIDKRTVAEFAETPQIRRRLAQLGVDYAQGYAIDEPTPIDVYFERAVPHVEFVAEGSAAER